MRGASLVSALVLTMGVGIACSNETPPAPPAAPAAPAPPPPAPATPDAAAKPKMVANPDGLSLADRIAKRQAAEKKLAAELADEENKRLLAYDKGKLPLHKEVFAAIKKYRAAYDYAQDQGGRGEDRVKQQKALEATGKKMATIDPKGGNSNVVTDYDVMLNAIANDYPDALSSVRRGQEAARGADRRARQADQEDRGLAGRAEVGQEVAPGFRVGGARPSRVHLPSGSPGGARLCLAEPVAGGFGNPPGFPSRSPGRSEALPRGARRGRVWEPSRVPV